MAGPSATGNYAQAGRAVSSAATDLFKINRQNAPDMAGLVQKAAQVKADEQKASYAIQSELLQRGVGEVAKTVNYKEGMDAEMNYKKAKRKAGILATGGAYVGTGLSGLNPEKTPRRKVGESSAKYNERIRALREQADEIRSTPVTLPGITDSETTA